MFTTRGVFKAPNCLKSELIKLLYQRFFLSEGFIFRSLILFTVMNGDKVSLKRQLNFLSYTPKGMPIVKDNEWDRKVNFQEILDIVPSDGYSMH